MSRAIFLAVSLTALPLPTPAEVAPAPTTPEAPSLAGTNRLPGEPVQIRVAPTLGSPAPDSFEKTPVAASNPQAPEVSPPPPSPCAETAGFSYGWLALSFAMLILGFVSGIVWLRERNRKKLGGMYLRI